MVLIGKFWTQQAGFYV